MSDGGVVPTSPVRRSPSPCGVLAGAYDVALLDLDGVVYVGAQAVPAAPEALSSARSSGMRLAFVTNNASRTSATVAGHLESLGISAPVESVITSAQAAAGLLVGMLPAGAAVLVVGGDGLVEALRERGLVAVRGLDEHPQAVVQGFAPSVGWDSLAEASYAVASGLPWVATNADRTIPTARGIAPGNGMLVAAVAEATGVSPVVAGKPELPMHQEAITRTGSTRPLIVGDRLDTDIEGAVRAGADSLLVLSGVTDVGGLLAAPPQHRPTYLGRDVGALLVEHPGVVGDGPWSCRGWTASVDAGELCLDASGPEPHGDDDGAGAAGPKPVASATPDGGPTHGSADVTSRGSLDAALDALRAACAAAWSTEGLDCRAATALLDELLDV